jgi:hypothetical protein
MTEEEIEKLGAVIAKNMKAHPPSCVTFDHETIEDIKAFFKRLRSCKAVAWSTFVSAVTYAVISAVIIGIGYKLLELIKK